MAAIPAARRRSGGRAPAATVIILALALSLAIELPAGRDADLPAAIPTPAAPSVRSGPSLPTGDLVNAGVFAGGYDEIIGAGGPPAADFTDGDYVQLRRPDDIPPIYAPEFVAPDAADWPEGEPVVGLALNGAARAYPAGILYRRELVNDVVGGVPALVSWCPLCYTALAHERRLDAATPVFGNQGALYRGAMTWYDHATGSVWSQPLGAAIAGPQAGRRLALLPAQLTTWGQWRAAHPDTLALAEGGIPAAPYRGPRPGEEHIAGIVIGDEAAAWPYPAVAAAGAGAPVTGRVGAAAVALWRDEGSGAIRARSGEVETPVIIAYRRAWEDFYGDNGDGNDDGAAATDTKDR